MGADQAEQLRKCSTDRLRIKLSKAGWDEETIATMGRDQLFDMLATLMLAPPPQSLVQGNPEAQPHAEKQPGLEPQRDQDPEISNAVSESSEVRLKELALEEKRIQGEFELRKAALEQEERKKARKAEERERARVAEDREKARQFELRKMEMRWKYKPHRHSSQV